MIPSQLSPHTAAKKSVPPVIVIGMHRSGTSMVTRMLRRLGLFLGKQRDSHDESEFFMGLNQWLLQQCGGAWDHPKPIDDLIIHPTVRALYTDYLQYMLWTRGRIQFLGWKEVLQGRNLFDMQKPWGWKDPRNTFTLPLWLDIFPHAKIIHIYRHGLDVARSLQKREREQVRISARLHERRKWLYWMYSKKNGFLDSPRCLSLPRGVQLWDMYMERATEHVEAREAHAYALQYEAFLANPARILKEMIDFCGLNATKASVMSCVENVDESRAFAYRKDTSFNMASEMRPILQKYGYDL